MRTSVDPYFNHSSATRGSVSPCCSQLCRAQCSFVGCNCPWRPPYSPRTTSPMPCCTPLRPRPTCLVAPWPQPASTCGICMSWCAEPRPDQPAPSDAHKADSRVPVQLCSHGGKRCSRICHSGDRLACSVERQSAPPTQPPARQRVHYCRVSTRAKSLWRSQFMHGRPDRFPLHAQLSPEKVPRQAQLTNTSWRGVPCRLQNSPARWPNVGQLMCRLWS